MGREHGGVQDRPDRQLRRLDRQRQRYTTTDDTALSWNNRRDPAWDFEEGVFAEVNFKDHEYIATESDTVLQVTVPIVLRQPIGSTMRVRVWWNGVVKFDENIPSSTTAQIDKDVTFSGTMGTEGKLKVEFFEPSADYVASACGIRDVMAVKTNTRTDTLIRRSDLPIGPRGEHYDYSHLPPDRGHITCGDPYRKRSESWWAYPLGWRLQDVHAGR